MHMTEADAMFLMGMGALVIFGGIVLVGWTILKIKQKFFNKEEE